MNVYKYQLEDRSQQSIVGSKRTLVRSTVHVLYIHSQGYLYRSDVPGFASHDPDSICLLKKRDTVAEPTQKIRGKHEGHDHLPQTLVGRSSRFRTPLYVRRASRVRKDFVRTSIFSFLPSPELQSQVDPTLLTTTKPQRYDESTPI